MSKAILRELEVHRAELRAVKAAGFESPGELLAAYKVLEKRAAALRKLIDDLALTPADEFYLPGDHMAGKVNRVWIDAGRIMGDE